MRTPSTRTDETPPRLAAVLRIDTSRPHPHPSPGRLVAATGCSLTGSLAAVALLVLAATRVSPALRRYEHFQFSDYATLTAVGVLLAAASWPVVTLVSSTPRWLFFRLAVAVTVLSWIPDLILLARRDPRAAVGYLMAMHLAVAIVTYQLLVRMAPATVQPPAAGDADPERLARHLATVLAVLVGVDLGLGVVTLVTVPTGRPSGWLPPAGAAAYGAHAFVGLVLVVGTVALASRVRGASRILRLTVWIGGTGVALAGAGGLLTASHPLRLAGIVLMLVGTLVAAFGFVLPVLDQLTEDGVPSPP